MNQTKIMDTKELSIPVTNGCAPLNAADMVETDNTKPVRKYFSSKYQPKSRKGIRNKVSTAFLADLYEVWTLETDGGPTLGTRVLLDVAVSDPGKLLAAMVQVLPKDFQVNVDVDQINWVINASPRLSVEEWQAEHGPEHHPEPVSSTETTKDTTG